ncbi:PREDICTED: protein TORNADO 2-like [Ipomoea nil]|uniref:protein TORNADO 2-like n=1 Tax=Ipomoea nil TaxID=35883 RepID=UPI0009010485|nr:PREDICTED: protein TORNADO 2-like [Ipomoea nil]
MAVTNNIMVGCINFTAMLLSIPIIGSGIWLSSQPDNLCVKILQWPLIIMGLVVLVLSLAGAVAGFWRIRWLLIFYLVAMLALIVLLACFVAMVYWVTLKGSGHPEPSRTFLEYRLDDYSGWLRRWVQSYRKWDGIRSCLRSSSMCGGLNQNYRLAQDFFNAHITPLQSGCCKPPTECGHTFVNPTYWISPKDMAADMDCLRWSNDQTQLCYSCDSCKAGLLANLYKEWRRVDIILGITLVALIAVYLAGCCAFRRAKTPHLSRKYKQGSS